MPKTPRILFLNFDLEVVEKWSEAQFWPLFRPEVRVLSVISLDLDWNWEKAYVGPLINCFLKIWDHDLFSKTFRFREIPAWLWWYLIRIITGLFSIKNAKMRGKKAQSTFLLGFQCRRLHKKHQFNCPMKKPALSEKSRFSGKLRFYRFSTIFLSDTIKQYLLTLRTYNLTIKTSLKPLWYCVVRP